MTAPDGYDPDLEFVLRRSLQLTQRSGPGEEVVRAEVVGAKRNALRGSASAGRPESRSVGSSGSGANVGVESTAEARSNPPAAPSPLKTALRRDEAICPNRLRRAVDLVPFVEIRGPQDFVIVRKGHPDYPVSLATDPSCYCKDTEYRGLICKHTLACRLRIFEKGAIQAWADIIEVRERQKKERRRKKVANG